MARGKQPVRIIGPGDRGELPPVSPRAVVAPQPLFPANPTPGTASMFFALMQAYATDLNDRVIDALRPSPLDYFQASDIKIPAAGDTTRTRTRPRRTSSPSRSTGTSWSR